MNKEKLEECSKLLEDSMSVLQKDTELWKVHFLFNATCICKAKKIYCNCFNALIIRRR